MLLSTLCLSPFGARGSDEWTTGVEEIVLPGIAVNNICKDSLGRIWLATNKGILLYDGFETIPLSVVPKNNFTKIHYSRYHNRLWICDNHELWSINCRTLEAKKVFRLNRDSNSTTSVYTNANQNSLLFALDNGSIYRLTSDEKIQPIVKTGNTVEHLIETEDGSIFFTSPRFLHRYIPGTGTMTVVRMPSTGQTTFYSGLLQSDGKLWINSNAWYRGLVALNVHDFSQEIYPQLRATNDLNRWVVCAAATKDAVFIAYENYSFYRFDKRTKRILDIAGKHKAAFYGKHVQCIFVDDNVVWIGTDKGIIKLTANAGKFNTLLSQHTPIVSSRSILKYHDTLYIASYSGIYCQQKKNDWGNLNAASTRMHNIFPYKMLDGGDKIYMGMETEPAFSVFHKTGDKLDIISMKEIAPIPEKAQIFSLIYSPEGKIWVGGSMGIVVFDTATSRILRYPKDKFDVNGSLVRNLFYDSIQKRIYAATENGLFIFSDQGQLLRLFNKDNTTGLHTNNLMFVTRVADRIWLGTKDDGAYVLDLKDIVTHLGVEEGLSDPWVYDMLFDRLDHAWMSTNNGLSCYDIRHNRFYNYFTADGLSADEFNHNSVLIDSAGLFYFGGINGVNQFDPESFKQNSPALKLFISGIKKWTKEGLNLNPIRTETSFTRVSDDYAMSIMLGVSDYEALQKIKFYYQIQGITNGWERISYSSHLFLPEHLPHGSYDVRLKAVNFRGTVSNVIHFQLELLAPVYYRWWFIATVLMAILGISYLIVKYRINEIKKYENLRIKIASNLHDEVGGLLTGIGMHSDNLAMQKNMSESTLLRTEKIALLSRQAISSMRDILWTIDARNDSVEALAEQIRVFAEDMLIPKNIFLQFSFENDRIRKMLPGDMRQHLYFFAKEAINNIAKHTRADRTEIKFILKNGGFLLSIRNNGVISNPSKTKGQGLKNMQMRANYLKANFVSGLGEEFFSVAICKDYPNM